MAERTGLEIAVVGMAGRFPGAQDLGELWRRMEAGEECIARFSQGELLEAGVDRRLLENPAFVPAAGVLDEPDFFDAPFFGFSAREAEILDPQHRQLLECAWAALESSGYDPAQLRGAPVGVFAGCGTNSYFFTHVLAQRELVERVGGFQTGFGIEKDHLAPLLAYKLGLEGPAVTVQTACSTALVAVHLACQALISGECDLALAGGASVQFPARSGYVSQGDGFYSPDGHCRPFDAAAGGTVPASGAGCVALRRLEDAVAARDPVLAVIRGSAVNNDGPSRAGYTAPRADGQAKVIRAAHLLAEVDPGSIGYVEAHGSATALGDPIEVAALTKAFRADTAARGTCALGSVKSNLGHTGAAAGAAGLIKTVLALGRRRIPPTVHFREPNPAIDLAASPFFVNREAVDWEAPHGEPRRAGVSSFGLGGTNAHVVLEEAPPAPAPAPSRPYQLVVVSAATPTAADAAVGRLAQELRRRPEADLADVAFTLQAGRRSLPHRRAAVCRDRESAVAVLEEEGTPRLLASVEEERPRPVAFLLPGLGDHYPGMGRGLYRGEPAFREALDRCAELLEPHLGCDLRQVLFAEEDGAGEPGAGGGGVDLRRMLGRGSADPGDGDPLASPRLGQPALFALEHALARLWISWGVGPEALAGYSLGEYTAACLAGVLSLEEALYAVARRGELLEGLPAGAMLAVPLAEEEVLPLLGDALSLAAVNGPGLSVVAGPEAAVEALARELGERGEPVRRLGTRRAFHSRMMEPAAPGIEELFRELSLRPPEIPYLSNVSGTWITAGEATDPAYWARHLVSPVRFGDALEELLAEPERCLVEVGPGASLSSLALQHPAGGGERVAVPSMRHAYEGEEDGAVLLGAAARLWLAGVRLDWAGFSTGEERRRLALPTYPFERRRYCLGVGPVAAGRGDGVAETVAAAPAPAPAAASHRRPALRTPFAAPRAGLEERIAGLWEELLGVAPVGVHDSFFELGGHSLLGTRMVARLRAAVGAELTLREVFETPTVAGLAGRLSGEGAASPGPAGAPPLVPVPRGETLPLSFAQQRLWFLDQLSPANPFYNLAAALRLTGRLEVRALARSVAEIVRRHETLRSRFESVGGQPAARILPPAEEALPLLDLTRLGEGAREALLPRLATRFAARPFDLARDRLVRVHLLRLAGGAHGVLFAMHHIVSDGWSMGVFVRELTALYGAAVQGREAALPPLPVGYPDYAHWQRRWLTGEVLGAEVEHWRRALEGLPPLLELPTDRPRPALGSFAGGRVEVRLAPELVAAVAELGRGRGATPFMVLLAAFDALLSRTAGQRDLAVGTAVANRPVVELEGLIGFFVNTLALRADLSGRPSFAGLLDRVRETALTAFAHADVPFEKLVEELVEERSLRFAPLVQVMLVLQNTPVEAVELPGLGLEPVDFGTSFARFDLTLSLAGDGERLGGTLEYNSDLFDRTTVLRLLDHYRTLLRGAAAAPERPVGELPLLSPAEAHQLAAEVNDTGAPEGEEPLLHRLFETSAAARPEAVAVVAPGAVWSYGALSRWVRGLARGLALRGVGPEVRVGVLAERSLELQVALLGVLAAGGVYLPLDPEQPAERLQAILEDAAPGVLVTWNRPASAPPLPAVAGSAAPAVVSVEEAAPPARPAGRAPLPPRADGAAYVLYTSGSTGRPKGVVVPHRAVTCRILWGRRVFGFGPGDRFLLGLPPAFDPSLWEAFSAFAAGAALVVLPPGEERDPAALLARLRRERVSVLSTGPAQLSALVPEAARGPRLPALQRIFSGGEALPRDLAARAAAALGPAPANAYGPTEAAIVATSEGPGGPPGSGSSVPVGRPVDRTLASVLGPGLALAPLGVAGELCLGGGGLARGYLGRPGRTAGSFVPDPGSPAPGARMYRTGDLVRRLADGRLEFLGRVDHQVKLRGVRIELGEVEAALARHPGVGQAVAALTGAGPGGRRLVAYVVAAAGADLEVAELREHCRGALPAAMVPAALVLLPDLPRTTTGKVDRRALPAAEGGGRAQVGVDYAAPRSPVEETLAAIWSRVLEVERVGIHDDFFELGGHSLLATQVVAQVRDAFGVELPVRVLFETPTVAGLADHLVEREAEGAGADEVAAALAAIEGMDEADVEALLAAGGGEEGEREVGGE